jgi:hypothetical protein
VILGFSVVAISEAYYTGLRALDAHATEAQVDGHLRSFLELLLAERFSAVASGQANVNVGGTAYQVVWTVTPLDLDGDALPEVAAKHVVITLRDRSLETVVVDHGGWVGKL